MVMIMQLKKGLKIAGKIVVGISLFVVLIWLGQTIGESIFKARYFKSLDDFEFLVVEEDPVCPLHERVPSNFPILVNTNEGSATELRMYETYVTYPLQIRENAEYGVVWLMAGKGWSGIAMPDNDRVSFSIQRDRMFNYSPEAARLFFCDDCIATFRELDPSCNFIIVDGYEEDNLKCYDIANNEDLQIRHYSFVVKDKGYDLLSMEMNSSYFNGGKELDFLAKEDTTEIDKHYDYENLPKP